MTGEHSAKRPKCAYYCTSSQIHYLSRLTRYVRYVSAAVDTKWRNQTKDAFNQWPSAHHRMYLRMYDLSIQTGISTAAYFRVGMHCIMYTYVVKSGGTLRYPADSTYISTQKQNTAEI